MCELAIDAAREHGADFHLGGYTNGCDGYLPTAAEFDRGGYEVLWSYLTYYIYHGRVMPLRRDSADRLVQAAAAASPDASTRKSIVRKTNRTSPI